VARRKLSDCEHGLFSRDEYSAGCKASFNERDTEAAPLVMIVNQALASRDFPNENPVGKRINLGNLDPKGQPVWWEIVGVAAMSEASSFVKKRRLSFYLSDLQDSFANMFLVFARRSSQLVGRFIRHAAAEVDSRPLYPRQDDGHIVSKQSRNRASICSFWVSSAALRYCCRQPDLRRHRLQRRERTHEFGIRWVGGPGRDVLRMIIRQGMLLIAVE